MGRVEQVEIAASHRHCTRRRWRLIIFVIRDVIPNPFAERERKRNLTCLGVDMNVIRTYLSSDHYRRLITATHVIPNPFAERGRKRDLTMPSRQQRRLADEYRPFASTRL